MNDELGLCPLMCGGALPHRTTVVVQWGYALGRPLKNSLRTIHEITRSGTKRALSSSHFVCFRGSSYLP